MDQPTAAMQAPDADAIAFIRFCYRRRRVGWPELYDEMCAVAGRGLYRGMCSDDLAAFGIGFSLFDMPALAALSATVVAEEQALRRPVAVMITVAPDPDEEVSADSAETAQPVQPVAADLVPDHDTVAPVERTIRFVTIPAGV
jgi:hypothetical protein